MKFKLMGNFSTQVLALIFLIISFIKLSKCYFINDLLQDLTGYYKSINQELA
jgi:hypothetical protein